MKTPRWIFAVLPGLLLLAGCPGSGGDGSGGNFTLGGASAPAIAYVANQGSNDVSAYTFSSTTGVLTAVSGSPFSAGTTPSAVAVSSNGLFVYVANSGGNKDRKSTRLNSSHT